MDMAAPVPYRRWLLYLASLGTICGTVYSIREFNRDYAFPVDYFQFWACGQLAVRGENPYDPDLQHATQRQAGMGASIPILSWHPPWTLAVMLPLGWLPFGIGYIYWIAVQAAAVVLAADLLWRSFGGPEKCRWISWLLAVSFGPTGVLLATAQLTGFCLLGVAGFTAGMRAGRPAVAGMALALASLKPHLSIIFGLALVLQSTRDRTVRIAVLACAVTLSAAVALVAAINPGIPEAYLDAITNRFGNNPYRVQDVPSPTLGWHLRAAIAPDWFAVSLAPLAAISACTILVWIRLGGVKCWSRAIPWLIGGSLLASPYGAWLYDLVLLLVHIFAVATRLTTGPVPRGARRAAIATFAAATGAVAAFILNWPGAPVAKIETVIFAPLILAAWLAFDQWLDREAGRTQDAADP